MRYVVLRDFCPSLLTFNVVQVKIGKTFQKTKNTLIWVVAQPFELLYFELCGLDPDKVYSKILVMRPTEINEI